MSVKRRVTWRDWRRRLAATTDLDGQADMTFKTARLQGITRSKQVELKAAFCDAALYRLWLDNLQRDEDDASPEALDGTRIGNMLNVTVSRIETFASFLSMQENEEIFADWDHGKFKRLWDKNDLFFEEAIKYLFRPSIYLSRAISIQEQIRKELMPKAATLEELAVQAAQLELNDALNDPLVELGAVVATSLPRNPTVRDALAELNRHATESWTRFYEEIVEHYGVRLRVGVKVEDFTELAAMITEGALVRSRALGGRPAGRDGSSRPPMTVGLGYIIRGILADSRTDAADAAVSSEMLSRYLRHIEFDGEVNRDPATLAKLQEGHLDAFAYSTLDVFLGKPYPTDPDRYLNYLMDTGHGGLCYQLNVALATILRAVGFKVEYLWGTVSGAAGRPGWPAGNHLGLQVACDGEKWLVDAGLGDGPRQPYRLGTHEFDQDGFVYEIADQGDTWIFTHAEGGSFAEVVFNKTPVPLEVFEEPARIQMTSPRSSFLKTSHVIQRREEEVWNMRGLELKIWSKSEYSRRLIKAEREWFRVLRREFGIYLGNFTIKERSDLWERVNDAQRGREE